MRGQYLEHGFESVVVDILVYVEGCEDIKRVAKVNLPQDGGIAPEDWEKMSGTDNGVDVHNRHDTVSAAIELGFDNPHAVVGVGVIEGFAIVVDKCTREKIVAYFK